MFKKTQSVARAFRMPAFDVEGQREEPSAVELKRYHKVLQMKNKTRSTPRGSGVVTQGARRQMRA